MAVRFKITRDWPDMPGFAQWYVHGDRPDWSGDWCWGHFLTHREAIEFTDRLYRYDPDVLRDLADANTSPTASLRLYQEADNLDRQRVNATPNRKATP